MHGQNERGGEARDEGGLRLEWRTPCLHYQPTFLGVSHRRSLWHTGARWVLLGSPTLGQPKVCCEWGQGSALDEPLCVLAWSAATRPVPEVPSGSAESVRDLDKRPTWESHSRRTSARRNESPKRSLSSELPIDRTADPRPTDILRTAAPRHPKLVETANATQICNTLATAVSAPGCAPEGVCSDRDARNRDG